MLATALLGLALAGAPIEDIGQIGAAYVAESGATDVACSQTPERTICYGIDAVGNVTAATYANGTFTSLTESPAEEAAPAATTTSFGPGMQLVGTDIAPGTYRATSEEDGAFTLCRWSRLSGVSGDSEDMISYESVHDPGVQVLTEILPTDYAFDSSGCGTWTPV